MEIHAVAKRPTILAWAFAAATAAAMAIYYRLLYYPPVLLGSNDPDRYYHLAIARMTVEHGALLRALPQVEDLGWGRYFPDKEFLFHALGAFAYKLGGDEGVLAIAPLCGIAVAACLYWALLRVLSPARAALLVAPVLLGSCAFLFRLSILRPHLLAILFFCLLLAALVRSRPWLAAAATAGYALAYHALYIPALVLLVALFVRWEDPARMRHVLALGAAGLVVGVIVNPYFPSTLVMSAEHLAIALGLGLPPGLQSGNELQPVTAREFLDWFSLLPIALLAAFAVRRRESAGGDRATFRFLLLLTLLLTGLSLKSSRATEYAIPSAMLLLGHVLARLSPRAAAGVVVMVLASQAHAAWVYYDDCFRNPQGGDSPWYFRAISKLPAQPSGAKVFNCEWGTGSYLLLARPDLRFVDLLEPAFLWRVSREKYVRRENLEFGADPDPHRTLREVFHADYVLCANQGLVRQMRADPRHFELLGPADPDNPLHAWRIRD